MTVIIRASVAAAALLAATGATPPARPGNARGDFCARLAIDSGIDKPAAADGRTAWTANAVNFGQRFLIGGSAATGVGVKPVEPASMAEYRRLDDMCMMKGNGALCHLVGPVTFKFHWKGRDVLTPLTAGERATVEVVGTKTRCQTETSA